MSEARCDNCRFWERRIAEPTYGGCCRHAPRPIRERKGKGSYEFDPPSVDFPVTIDVQWCGEFEAKISPEEKAKLDALARKVKEDSQPKFTQNMP